MEGISLAWQLVVVVSLLRPERKTQLIATHIRLGAHFVYVCKSQYLGQEATKHSLHTHTEATLAGN